LRIFITSKIDFGPIFRILLLNLGFIGNSIFAQPNPSPVAPGQPLTGPGGGDYRHAKMDSALFGSNIADMYWLFEPNQPKPDSAFVIVYWHGTNENQDSTHVPAGHFLFIQHLVKKGYLVIFPLYQYGGNTLPFEKQLLNGGQVVEQAFNELQTGTHPKPFLNAENQIRYAMTGISRGGGMTLNTAAYYQTLNLPPAEALCAFVPGAGNHLEQIPTTTRVLIITAAEDTEHEESHFRAWENISHIPCGNKHFLRINSDNHGLPVLIAEHDFAGSGRDPDDATKVNTLDYYGAWKPATALFNTVFYGTDAEYCLESPDSITFMGHWSDDVPVNPLSILDSCAATHIPANASVDGWADFRLRQNYPNPFNPSTHIEFILPKPAFVTVKVYNLQGAEIATLIAEHRAAGIHHLHWDVASATGGSDLASGVYWYRLEAGDFTRVKKMILLR